MYHQSARLFRILRLGGALCYLYNTMYNCHPSARRNKRGDACCTTAHHQSARRSMRGADVLPTTPCIIIVINRRGTARGRTLVAPLYHQSARRSWRGDAVLRIQHRRGCTIINVGVLSSMWVYYHQSGRRRVAQDLAFSPSLEDEGCRVVWIYSEQGGVGGGGWLRRRIHMHTTYYNSHYVYYLY
jgi:hypothetical protein